MTGFLLNWLIVAAAVWITSAVLPGFRVKNFWQAILVAAVFGLLNFALGWLLFVVFGIGTLGIAWLLAFVTWWIIDAIVLKLTDVFLGGFEIDGFLWALLGAAMIAGVTSLGHWAIG